MPKQKIPEEQRSKALKYYYKNLEANRARSRANAKAYYYANKEAKLLKNAEYRKANPDRWKLIKHLSSKKYYRRRFFFIRACAAVARVSGFDAETLCTVLSKVWYRQRGRCAYTGKRLDRNAHVDHKVPVSRGGTNDESNLQWVTADANLVKGRMTHDEFISICSDVSAYIESKKPSK